jgi:hypothetical protein
MLGGGHVGKLRVTVYKAGFGFSAESNTDPAANFEYIILIDSVLKNDAAPASAGTI